MAATAHREDLARLLALGLWLALAPILPAATAAAGAAVLVVLGGGVGLVAGTTGAHRAPAAGGPSFFTESER